AHRADDEGDPAPDEELLPDQHGRHHVEHEPGERDRVGGQARLDQAIAHGVAAHAGLPAPWPGALRGRGHHALAVRKAQAVGRARASQLAAHAERPAVTAPSMASERKWLPVATITKVTSSGYRPQAMRVMRCLDSRASVTPISSAKHTCIDGTAA